MSSENNRILKNSVFLSAGHVVAKLINIILVLILTRYLGTDNFGLYSVGLAYVMLFMIFTHFGIASLIVRDISRDLKEAGSYLSTLIPAIATFSVLTVVAANLIARGLGWSPDELAVIFAFSMYLFFDAWSRVLKSIFRAFQQMEFEAITQIAERVGLLLVALIAWFLDWALLHVVWGFATVQMLRAIMIAWLVHHRFCKISMQWQPAKVRELLASALPFALFVLFGVFSTRIDIIMLKEMQSVDVAGIYNVSRKIIESVAFLPENIYGALLPALSVMFMSEKARFGAVLRSAFFYMAVLAIPLVIFLFTFSYEVIDLLFSQDFITASLPLKWLGLTLGIMFTKYVLIAGMNSSNLQVQMSILAGITTALNIGLNFILIPPYSLLGASIATLISESITALAAAIILRQHIVERQFLRKMLFLCAISGSMLPVVFVEDVYIRAGLFIAGCLVYTGLLFASKIIKIEELKRFKQQSWF